MDRGDIDNFTLAASRFAGLDKVLTAVKGAVEVSFYLIVLVFNRYFIDIFAGAIDASIID